VAKVGQAPCCLRPGTLLVLVGNKGEAEDFPVLGLGGPTMFGRANAQAANHVLVQVANG